MEYFEKKENNNHAKSHFVVNQYERVYKLEVVKKKSIYGFKEEQFFVKIYVYNPEDIPKITQILQVNFIINFIINGIIITILKFNINFIIY